MEQLKPLSTMSKVSIMGGLPLIGGGKSHVIFCAEKESHSTFFNFVFYFICVLGMWLLSGGNVCAQTTLSLNNGENYSIDGTVVEFHDDGTTDGRIGNSFVGGADWAATYSSGETHTFTVSLNNYSGPSYKKVVGELHIAALDCVISDRYVSYSDHIVAEAWIDPTNNNTNNVLTLEVNGSYAAVYLFKKNRETNYEYVDIASVTRTVSSGMPSSVDISESEDNTITAKDNATVRLYRTLTAGTWNTICLPFVPSSDQVIDIFGEGAKFAEFSSVSNGVMQFTSVAGSLVAGKPYLVLPTQDKTASSPIVLTGVNITATEPETVTHDNYQFKGIYSPEPFEKDDYTIRFVGTGNQLLYPNKSNSLKALRAYFIVGASGGAKNYTYAVDSFVPTSIANIQIEGDGDGAIYNIGGQRVEGKSLPKGIYIREGKKFVVK